MRRTILLAAIASLISAPTAGGRILPIFRAYPWGNRIYGYNSATAPQDGGITSTLVSPYPWSRVTIAYNTSRHTILVGCRGRGHQLVRIWTHGHGWKLTTCDGLEPWQTVLRHITPAIPIHVRITFQ